MYSLEGTNSVAERQSSLVIVLMGNEKGENAPNEARRAFCRWDKIVKKLQ